ncbi:UNVERIFIED_ORG: oligopeptide/dipeptide ABC transporter ATP-binding protein [Rhizobium aethiopicum]
MGIKNYLIEGGSGTGKTSVATELERRGYHVVHGDRVLAYVGDPETGRPLAGPPEGADRIVWGYAHWIWPVDKVRTIAADTTRPSLEGRPPNLAMPPEGCRFHPRCPKRMEICSQKVPPLVTVEPGRRVAAALHHVGLTLEEVKGRFPHELSGGQLQRVAIARALIPEPRLLMADEPVSMVDASLRMAIVNLFGRLKTELGLSIIYITHDLATAYYVSDNNIIMRKGEIVERGRARTVLDDPQHAYSRALKDAVLAAEFGEVV